MGIAAVVKPCSTCHGHVGRELHRRPPSSYSAPKNSPACMQAAVGAFSCISLCLAYVADKMPARHRGATFGFIMASFSFGVVIGPMAGALLSPLGAAWFAVGGAAFNCLYTALLLPESLSPESRKLVCLIPLHPHTPSVLDAVQVPLWVSPACSSFG